MLDNARTVCVLLEVKESRFLASLGMTVCYWMIGLRRRVLKLGAGMGRSRLSSATTSFTGVATTSFTLFPSLHLRSGVVAAAPGAGGATGAATPAPTHATNGRVLLSARSISRTYM